MRALTNNDEHARTAALGALLPNSAIGPPRQIGIARVYVILAVLVLGIALGGVGTMLYLHAQRGQSQPPSAAGSQIDAHPAAHAEIQVPTAESDLEILLSREVLNRANLKMTTVVSRRVSLSVRVPGVVQSNAYREVRVTPLVGGVVIKVSAQLGDSVRRGQPLVRIFSAELAQAQEQYLTMQAELEVEHKKLKRAGELAEIGAASRQELEEVQATHEVHQSHVQAARQRLILLGISEERVSRLADPSQITSEVEVPAPINGIVLNRTVNQGQVVALGQELFTITDLSNVWVIGDLFEKDFALVRTGSSADIGSPAYPSRVYHGRVSYFDPRVDAQTRTAKVRVEVDNPGLMLKIGMYVDVSFHGAEGAPQPAVTRDAVQSLGPRQVVYLPVDGEEGRFVQRTVKLGEEVAGYYRVVDGLKPGDVVVNEGSFFLRSESLRQHPAQ